MKQGRGMNLLIDTTEKGVMVLELWRGGKKIDALKKVTDMLSEELLIELGKFLEKNKVSLKEIDQILVNPGPGAFSSTRTGVATANALALALNVPLAEWPRGKIKEVVQPKYDKEPNITKPRK